MTFTIRGHQTALVSALLAGAVITASQPAAAQGADRFAGARSAERMRVEDQGRDYRDPQDHRAPRGYCEERRGGGFFGWAGWGSNRADYDYDRYDPEPVKAHVSSPRYLTYKPDELETVSLEVLSRAVAEAAVKRQQAAAEAEAERKQVAADAAATAAAKDAEAQPENVAAADDSSQGVQPEQAAANAGVAVNDADAQAGNAETTDVVTGSIATSGDNPNEATVASDDTASEGTPASDVVAAEDASTDPAPQQVATADTGTDATATDADTPAAAPVVETPVDPSAPTPFERDANTLASLKLRALPQVIDAIEAHYTKQTSFVWVKDGKVSDKALAAMRVLAAADTVGLDLSDYRVELPHDTVAMQAADVEVASNNTGNDGILFDADDTLGASGLKARTHESELMRFEMELSAAVLTYALDAERGRIAPDRISEYHDLPRHKVDLDAVMTEFASSEDVAADLEARNPTSKEFKGLVATLAELKASDAQATVSIAPHTLIKPGESDPEMANVIKAISLKASDDLKAEHVDTFDTYDGGETYTPELVPLVKDYQREAGLSADGVVGPNTVRSMVGMTNAAKIERVKLAMERMRWLPRDLGDRRVFINQPAFTATYVQKGRDPLSMRVVVGKKSNQTNSFYDHIETVEYNPYWGVPYSIIVNEMLPKLNKNPYYLDDAGYEVTTVNGREVSSASVDWRAVVNKQESINVRQRPGRFNALGQLKILFPNKHHIYMHDTPAKSLFNRANRAFSHGCVRLQDPQAMAAAVLGKDKAYVNERIAEGKNEADPVSGNIPVYVSYFTAWPDAKTGTVRYFPDIYDRDMYLSRAIEATREARHR
ncbi:L,D-transpeptidase family protein [Breoghania sp.]|uniref:L,D-transpeptidase family protein n=1 Tax=Breoghania sp. TaxID=2065378 RepID=UPI002634B4E9|nr:L,D-transpeptidase family protein [Breoghania sp.]MDJ0930236.1 L,D-transpeptidase family protein [Breoghania sp.]